MSAMVVFRGHESGWGGANHGLLKFLDASPESPSSASVNEAVRRRLDQKRPIRRQRRGGTKTAASRRAFAGFVVR